MLKFLVLSSLFYVLTIEDANAYLDFGTGSYMLQIVAASAIGSIYFVKRFFGKIKQFFIKNRVSDQEPEKPK